MPPVPPLSGDILQTKGNRQAGVDEEGLIRKTPSRFNHNVVNVDTRPCGKGVFYVTAGNTAFWRVSEEVMGTWGLGGARRKSW